MRLFHLTPIMMWSFFTFISVVSAGALDIGKVETIFGNSMGLDSRGVMKGNVTGVWDDVRQYKFLTGVAVDDFGTLYVADEFGIRYSKSRSSDKIEHFTGPFKEYGIENGPAEESKFDNPVSVAVSKDGSKVFVSEPFNGAIRAIITDVDVNGDKTSKVYTLKLKDYNGIEMYIFPGYIALSPPRYQGDFEMMYMTSDSSIWYDEDFSDHTIYELVFKDGYTPNENGEIEGMISIINGVQHTSGFKNNEEFSVFSGPSLFSTPKGMTVDKNRHCYIADSDNNVIRMMDTMGFTSTFAGDHSGKAGFKDGDKDGKAMFSKPSDIVYDESTETFYVADTGNNAIRKINKNGIVRTLAGGNYAAYADGVGGCARLTRPSFLAIGPNKTLYFTDLYHSTVRKINLIEGDGYFTEYCRQQLTGKVITIAGKPYEEGHTHGTNNTLDEPSDVAVDKYGNIFFTDDDAHCIRKMSRSGFVSVVAGKCDEYGLVDGYGTNARFEDIYSIAINDDGVIYVADRDNEVIRRVSKNGYVSIFAGNPYGNYGDEDGEGTNAEFDGPYSVTLDNRGHLYVADRYNDKVKMITPRGHVTTIIHKDFFNGQLRAVEYDKFNDRLIVMYDEHIFSVNKRGWWSPERVIGRRGDVHNHGTVIDAGVGSAAGFYNPYGLAIDAAGFIFVSDSDNHVIRMISPGPKRTVTTIAGAYDLQGGHADGFGNRARFDWPWGIALDHFGNLIVADADTSTLRKIRIMRPPVA